MQIIIDFNTGKDSLTFRNLQNATMNNVDFLNKSYDKALQELNNLFVYNETMFRKDLLFFNPETKEIPTNK